MPRKNQTITSEKSDVIHRCFGTFLRATRVYSTVLSLPLFNISLLFLTFTLFLTSLYLSIEKDKPCFVAFYYSKLEQTNINKSCKIY